MVWVEPRRVGAAFPRGVWGWSMVLCPATPVFSLGDRDREREAEERRDEVPILTETWAGIVGSISQS